MPRFPSAQGRLNHDPGFHLSCDENLSEGWGPPLGLRWATSVMTDPDVRRQRSHPTTRPHLVVATSVRVSD